MKLTKQMREDILEKLLSKRFDAEIEKQRKQWIKLASDCYDHVYPLAERKLMARLPEGWLPLSDSVCLAFGTISSSFERLWFNGRRITMYNTFGSRIADAAPIFKLAPYYAWNASRGHPIDREHALAKRYFALAKDEETLLRQHAEAAKQGMQALNAASTLKHLERIWPEVKPFLPKVVDGERLLPVPIISTLNGIFQLP